MTSVKSEEDVSVPISVVYDQWTQFESFPQFMDSIQKISQTDDTHSHWVVKIAGVEREFDTVITEQIPDERIAWKSVEGDAHSGVVTFHRLGDAATRIVVQLEWKPEGFVEHLGAILQVDDIAIDRDLEKFKEIIEANGFETGSWRGTIDRAPGATGR